MVITLTEDDSKALRQAGLTRRRARVESALALAQRALRDLEFQETMERLGETYGFDPDAPMAFDDRAHTLTPVAENSK